ncbi:hypothetical protein EXIGLDRAFT_773417 [Exidia glandulosa HHB12029]|uniref:Uncharacterized protein n=1 Tax=Exidia glandulosa HHB12029 TaxID=1314781 RepID=A0A165EUA0_EXIGL|nr:hypothetical protein EXIGLDRAFT_773417 [Exidia glandulosa HHB12029]
MPAFASPASSPTHLSTPFMTPSMSQSPFEYPFTTSSPSPALSQDNHYNWQAQHGGMSTKSPKTAVSPPVPPALLTAKGQQRGKRAVQDGGPVAADSTRIVGANDQQTGQSA